MTRIKWATSRSVFELCVMLIATIMVVVVSVYDKYPKVAFVSAFSAVPSHSYASTKNFLQLKTPMEQFKRSSGLPSSTLFARQTREQIDVDAKSTLKPQNWIEIEMKNKNNEIQRALAGVALCLTIATTTLGGFPMAANAQFGPSSGATTTPVPNLNSIKKMATKVPPQDAETADFDIDLDGKKTQNPH